MAATCARARVRARRAACALLPAALLLVAALPALATPSVPSPVCEAQNLCTCWTNTTATQPPACYSMAQYRCPTFTALVAGTEASCSIPRTPVASPSPLPVGTPTVPPSPVCEAQNLCTCWTNTTATQPPACYSTAQYRCPTFTRLVAGTEASCSIPRPSSPSPRPASSPSPAPIIASPSPRLAPSPSPRLAPSPSPRLAPSPSPRLAPSPSPRLAPSPSPLLAPSPSPRLAPSPSPLLAPSPSPLLAPSPSPRLAPSPSPRLAPSPSPLPVRSPSPTPAAASPAPSTRTLLFEDQFVNFNTSVWNYEIGDGSDYGIPGWGNGELECYTSSSANVAVINNPDVPGDGVLRLRGVYSATPQPCINRYQPASSKQWTSGRINTRDKLTLLPGDAAGTGSCTPISVESRIKLANKQGAWEAFWMLPQPPSPYGGWPRSGEIDIMEHVNMGTSAYGTIHFATPSGAHAQLPANNEIPLGATAAAGWNVYRVDWSCDWIRWYVNGVLKLQATRAQVAATGPWVFDKPFYIILNLALGGAWPGNTVDLSGPEMLVDWVRVWSVPVTPPAPPPTNFAGAQLRPLFGVNYAPYPSDFTSWSQGGLYPPYGGDFFNTDFSALWGAPGRSDLATVARGLRSNTLRLYSMKPQFDHGPFLAAAAAAGLRVIVPLSNEALLAGGLAAPFAGSAAAAWITDLVAATRAAPATAAWGLTNELNLDPACSAAATFAAACLPRLVQAARLIDALDPAPANGSAARPIVISSIFDGGFATVKAVRAAFEADGAGAVFARVVNGINMYFSEAPSLHAVIINNVLTNYFSDPQLMDVPLITTEFGRSSAAPYSPQSQADTIAAQAAAFRSAATGTTFPRFLGAAVFVFSDAALDGAANSYGLFAYNGSVSTALTTTGAAYRVDGLTPKPAFTALATALA